VLVVDKIGLPVESSGSLDKNHSAVMSSIMKNAARLQTLLSAAPEDQIDTAAHKKVDADVMAKIHFGKETLTIRHKHGLTLAMRSNA
jgi:hypothetical protein